MAVFRSTPLRWTVLCSVLAVAIALRVLDFPDRYAVRDMDETGYCHGCLQLMEGITPGNKAAPAGPLYWAGWCYVAGEIAWDFLHPHRSALPASPALRPFIAVDRVLSDNYRDVSGLHRTLVGLSVALSVAGVAAGFGLGLGLGGTAGGLLIGTLFAATPVFLSLSEMSRPYSMAWSFGWLALYFSSRPRKTLRPAWILTAIFLGLSIASRIEMLCLIPIVWWVWAAISDPGTKAGPMPDDQIRMSRIQSVWGSTVVLAKVTLLSLCIASWIAPWLVTHAIGNLRTIATVRFEGTASLPWKPALMEMMFQQTPERSQGLGLVILLALVGIWFSPRGSRVRIGLLAGYTLVLTITMLIGYADGIHQHGPVLIAWLVLLASVIGPLLARWPRAIGIALGLALMFPLAEAIRLMRYERSMDDHEESVSWVERHVPAGTTVYLIDAGQRSLLPTPEAATALWTEVTDDQAWRKKMESGLRRFNLSVEALPRALSEENLIQERSNRRKWFILGGQSDLPIPRYNIKVVLGSPVFGVRDLDAAMKKSGGLLVWRDGYQISPPAFLGQPVMHWVNASGFGVRIYCSPELRSKLH